MSSLERSIDAVRRVHQQLGTPKFAAVAGVPYTTVLDCSKRAFVGPSIETLIKLIAAAEQIEADAEPDIRAAGGDE